MDGWYRHGAFICPIGLLAYDYCLEYEDRTYDAVLQLRHTALFLSALYIMGELLSVFGSLCVHSDGAQFCGAGAERDGRAMLGVGVFFVLVPVIVWMYSVHFAVENDKFMARVYIMAFNFNLFVWPSGAIVSPGMLLCCGVVCDQSGRLCGAGGASGGKAMIGTGVCGGFFLCVAFARKLERAGVVLRNVTFEGASTPWKVWAPRCLLLVRTLVQRIQA